MTVVQSGMGVVIPVYRILMVCRVVGYISDFIFLTWILVSVELRVTGIVMEQFAKGGLGMNSFIFQMIHLKADKGFQSGGHQ